MRADEVPAITQVRVRPGHEASLVDISTDGVLIDTPLRLLPGRHVELLFERAEDTAIVRGRVIRCLVARVRPTTVSYEGAIGFDKPLGWLSSDCKSRQR